MGVYIPQLDIPTSCAKCGFNRRKEGDYLFVGCQLILNVIQNARDGSRYKGCPLVEIKEREDGLYERIN